MKLRKKRRCSGDFTRNVLETLLVSHRLSSLRSHQTIARLITRRPLHIAILKSRDTNVIEYLNKFNILDKNIEIISNSSSTLIIV